MTSVEDIQTSQCSSPSLNMIPHDRGVTSGCLTIHNSWHYPHHLHTQPLSHSHLSINHTSFSPHSVARLAGHLKPISGRMSVQYSVWVCVDLTLEVLPVASKSHACQCQANRCCIFKRSLVKMNESLHSPPWWRSYFATHPHTSPCIVSLIISSTHSIVCHYKGVTYVIHVCDR